MALISSLTTHSFLLPQKSNPSPQKPTTHIPFSSLSNLNTTHQIPATFTSQDLITALRRQKNATSALHLFQWATDQPSFTPDSSVFEEILRQLGKAGSFSQMVQTLKQMQLSQCKIDGGIFVVFIESYAKFQLLDDAISVVQSLMPEFGVEPDTRIYNFLLNILVEENRLKLVEEVHSSMSERGLQPDVSTFNILIKALCKAHQLKPAVSMMEEMEKHGLT